MGDFRDRISSHVCNDEDRLYRFVRDSRTPTWTFKGPWYLSPSGFLWCASAVIGVCLLLAVTIVV